MWWDYWVSRIMIAMMSAALGAIVDAILRSLHII